jgi:CarD family transcriptional regulator
VGANRGLVDMYEVGDVIIYGSTGVCCVTEIRTIDSKWSDKDELHYVLKPFYQDCVILTPVTNVKVRTRPAVSRTEAEQLIDTIPSIEPQVYHSDKAQEMVRYYKSFIEAYDCSGLLELTVSLRAKKDSAGGSKSKFGTVDQKFMTQAEELLFGELAVALGIPRSDVPGYIASRLAGFEPAVSEPPAVLTSCERTPRR